MQLPPQFHGQVKPHRLPSQIYQEKCLSRDHDVYPVNKVSKWQKKISDGDIMRERQQFLVHPAQNLFNEVRSARITPTGSSLPIIISKEAISRNSKDTGTMKPNNLMSLETKGNFISKLISQRKNSPSNLSGIYQI